MSTLPDIADLADSITTAAVRITIVYEDRTGGFRAKRFSDMLVAALGSPAPVKISCWRSELIELPEAAAMMADDANGTDFLILSFRGDTHLSSEQKHWIETWANGAAGGPAVLIALFDPARATVRHAESARLYLRQIANTARLGFFAHCSFATDETFTVQEVWEPNEMEVSPVSILTTAKRGRNQVAA